MSDFSIANRYAKAIFSAALEKNALQPVASDFEKMGDLLSIGSVLFQLVSNPMVPASTKWSAIEKVIPGLQPVTKQSLILLGNHKRDAFLPSIISGFLEMVDAETGVIRPEVTTAIPMSDAQKKELAQVLSKKTGKKVTIKPTVDPSIKGGMIVRIKDTVYDTSLKNRLEMFKKKLLN